MTQTPLIYLDNAATTFPHPAVSETYAHILNHVPGNPSSLHRLGVAAAEQISLARKSIAIHAGLTPEWLTFTSGATEANTAVLLGCASKANSRLNRILVSPFEHSSIANVLPLLKDRGYTIDILKPDSDGLITPRAVAEALTEHTALVTLIGIHNEIGVIQNIAAIHDIIKSYNPQTKFHVDGVQWFGKKSLPAPTQMPDFFTFSSHKIHGPKGVGGLFKKPSIYLHPLIPGGGQENGLRGGTEHVAGIVALAKALELAEASPTWERLQHLQKKMYDHATHSARLRWLGPPPGPTRSPYISLFTIKNMRSEIVIHRLEEHGIFISSGSACSEKNHHEKPYTTLFQLTAQEREGVLRVSFSKNTTEHDVAALITQLQHLEIS